ncbi:MAG: ABC transporter permease [Lachnospiraceae bacterium]|nr:ABC transporter permease [Lachnospiraceae bacterium]
MHTLTKLYATKIRQQKLVYIFFACFFMASFFYAFLISTPEMEELLNIDVEIVGKGNFPEFMMRFYVGAVGILFQVFLLTMFLCEEDRAKMLYQPLLHGESRSRIVKSKIIVAASMSMIFVLLTAIINYVTAYMRWGSQIFEVELVMGIVSKYILSGIYMSCLSIGTIALSICIRNTWKTIFCVIVYMVADSFVCNTGILFLKKIWIGYYPNLWTFTYEYRSLPLKDALAGIVIMVLYGIFFYQMAQYKIKKMNF